MIRIKKIINTHTHTHTHTFRPRPSCDGSPSVGTSANDGLRAARQSLDGGPYNNLYRPIGTNANDGRRETPAEPRGSPLTAARTTTFTFPTWQYFAQIGRREQARPSSEGLLAISQQHTLYLLRTYTAERACVLLPCRARFKKISPYNNLYQAQRKEGSKDPSLPPALRLAANQLTTSQTSNMMAKKSCKR